MDAATLAVMIRVNGAEAAAGDLRKVDSAGRNADKGLQGFHKTASRSGGVLGGMSTSFKAVGAAVGLTGLAGGVIAAGKTLIGFDQAMRNVNSIAGLGPKQFKALSASVNELGGKTAQAPQTLAEGMYQLVSSGFDAHQSLEILKSSSKAATAGLTDTATATQAVAAVLNAYHRPASDAAQVSDDLFQTVNRGVLSFGDLAQNIGDVLPFASALHVGLKEVGAATATMTKAGVSAPETMTRIKSTMSALIKPSDDLKGAYKQLGVESGDQLIHKFGNFQNALQALAKTTGGSKEAMSKLFPDIRALGGALLLTGNNAKGAKQDLSAFASDSGITDKTFKEQSKSISVQWHKVVAEMQSAVIDLGTAAVPTLVKGLKGASKLIEEIRENKGQGKDVRSTFSDIGDGLTKTYEAGAKTKDVLGQIQDWTGGNLVDVFGSMKDDMDYIFSGFDSHKDPFNDWMKGVANGPKIKDAFGPSQMTSGNVLANQLNAIKGVNIPDKTVRILASDADAKSKIESLKGIKLPDKMMKVLASDSGASVKLAALGALANKVPSSKVMKILTDLGSSTSKLQQLNSLSKAATVSRQLKVAVQAGNAVAALNAIKGTKLGVKVQKILAEDGPARAKIAALEALGLSSKTATLLAQDNASGTIASVIGQLGSIPRSVTTVINTVESITKKHAAGRGPGHGEVSWVGEERGYPEWVGSSPDSMALVHGPTMMGLSRDDYVIPTNPARKGTADKLWAQLGVKQYAKGKKGKHSKRLVPSHVYAHHSTDYYDGVVSTLEGESQETKEVKKGSKTVTVHTSRALRARRELVKARKEKAAAHKYAAQIEKATKEADIQSDNMAAADKLDDQGKYDTAYGKRRDAIKQARALLRVALGINKKANPWNQEMRGQLASLGSDLADMPQKPASILPAAGDLSTYSKGEQGFLDAFDRNIALDALTADTGDDKRDLSAKAAFLQSILGKASASGGAGRGGIPAITAIATDLKQTRDSIDGLSTSTSASQDATGDLQAQLDQAKAKADAAQRSSDINAAALTVFGGPGDIGTGGANGFQAGGGVTVHVNTLHPGTPATLRAIGDAATQGIGYQQPRQSALVNLG